MLIIVEWSTIALGLVAATFLLVQHYARRPTQAHDDSVAAVEATSACTTGTTKLGTLRAWLDGADLPAEPAEPAPPIDATVRTRGATLFAAHCATCHGVRGDGTGPTAKELQHPPANFTTGTYELRTTEHEALPADLDLFRTITRGVHGTAMPPWFALPERDRWALVAHLKTLSTQFLEDEAPAPIDVHDAPPVTPERLAHGRQLFETAGCASCHGATGRGDGPAAGSLFYKSSGLHVTPRDLKLGRFHRTTRLDDIYLTIAAGLDGTPMASFAKVLARDDLWDVAMYVQGLTPPVTVERSGLRCPHLPAELRCFELPTGLDCPTPTLVPDELVGVRMLVRSLHPTN